MLTGASAIYRERIVMDQMTEIELFEVGESANWCERARAPDKHFHAKMRKEYGEGPFSITQVEKAHGEVAKLHPQAVWICVDERSRDDVVLSGIWFRHTRH